MQAVIDTKDALEQVFIDIKTFQDQSLNRAVYHAPIIDHFHPNNYSQKGIAGLSKFRDSVEAEIGYVQGVSGNRKLFIQFDSLRRSSIPGSAPRSSRPMLQISKLYGVNSAVPNGP